MEELVHRFIDAQVRFADESGMREDGENRYMWLLSTSSLCLFLAGQTRAAKVLSDLLAAHLVSGTIAITESPARHPGVQDLQNIFRQNPHRLYHWAADRRVPAENNYSERGLRPWVIARHLSFGTQSAQGSWRRTVLMSVLHSLAKQGDDPVQKICEALALQRADPARDAPLAGAA